MSLAGVHQVVFWWAIFNAPSTLGWLWIVGGVLVFLPLMGVALKLSDWIQG
jgi:hypothetical protein